MHTYIDDLCASGGLIKSKLLNRAGVSIQNFASKRKHHGLCSEQHLAMLQALSSIATSIDDCLSSIDGDSDHSILVELLHSQAYVKKGKLLEILGESGSFFHDSFSRSKKLDNLQLHKLKQGLTEISRQIRHACSIAKVCL